MPAADNSTGRWRTGDDLHPVTWTVWALTAAMSIEVAPHPAYVSVVIAIAAVIVLAHGRATALARAFPALLTLGVSFALLRIVLTTLTTHSGEDVLARLPSFTLPRLLGGFTVGGTVESTVLLEAAAQSFVVVGIMAVFGAFNAVVSHYQLVQSVPRAFYEIGVIVTVAIAFIPSTLAAAHRVREADRARTGGRVVRRGRLLRVALPLLENGMEQAIALSESMDARGFARTGSGKGERGAGIAALFGLAALGASFVALVGQSRMLAVALAAAGASGVMLAIVLASRGTRRARYRRRGMARRDWLVVSVATCAPLGLGVLAAVADVTLGWLAGSLTMATLHLPALACLALLLAPALVAAPTAAPRRGAHPSQSTGRFIEEAA